MLSWRSTKLSERNKCYSQCMWIQALINNNHNAGENGGPKQRTSALWGKMWIVNVKNMNNIHKKINNSKIIIGSNTFLSSFFLYSVSATQIPSSPLKWNEIILVKEHNSPRHTKKMVKLCFTCRGPRWQPNR